MNEQTKSTSFPKAVEAVSLSLACAVIGGIWLGSHVSHKTRPTLAIPTVLLIAGGVLLAVGLVMVATTKGFAWSTFVTIGKWTLLAYVLESGMILYAFVHNHVRGSTLGVVIGLIALFALDVPFLVATTAARYDTPGQG